MTLYRCERQNGLIAAAVSAGKNISRCGEKFSPCKTCGGAGLLPPLLPGEGFGIRCTECHGKGIIKICEPKNAKFGPLSESLKGAYKNARA